MEQDTGARLGRHMMISSVYMMMACVCKRVMALVTHALGSMLMDAAGSESANTDACANACGRPYSKCKRDTAWVPITSIGHSIQTV